MKAELCLRHSDLIAARKVPKKGRKEENEVICELHEKWNELQHVPMRSGETEREFKEVGC